MKFQNLPKSAQEELLKKQEITGFDNFGFRIDNKRLEVDVFLHTIDEFDSYYGWEAVTV